MLCSPEELLQKSQALSNTWQRYLAAPSFESFVELAVSINSFTEFLIDKGITALHHASHQLEQVTLALFNKEVAHPLPQDALDDLNERLLALGRMASTHATATADLAERRHDLLHPTPHDLQVSQPWLIGQDRAAWGGLLVQLGYFGMTASCITWDESLPDTAGVAPLLLLDLGSLPSTGSGIGRAAASAVCRSPSSRREGSRRCQRRKHTSSKVACRARSWMSWPQ